MKALAATVLHDDLLDSCRHAYQGIVTRLTREEVFFLPSYRRRLPECVCEIHGGRLRSGSSQQQEFCLQGRVLKGRKRGTEMSTEERK